MEYDWRAGGKRSPPPQGWRIPRFALNTFIFSGYIPFLRGRRVLDVNHMVIPHFLWYIFKSGGPAPSPNFRGSAYACAGVIWICCCKTRTTLTFVTSEETRDKRGNCCSCVIPPFFFFLGRQNLPTMKNILQTLVLMKTIAFQTKYWSGLILFFFINLINMYGPRHCFKPFLITYIYLLQNNWDNPVIKT